MLTPQEITEKVFVKAVFGGYDMTGVDDFLEALSTDYTALYQENAILKGKLKVLVEKVEEYRSTEDAMRMALLTAQRTGEEITIEANKQKEAAIRSADVEIKVRLEDMARRVADEELRLNVAAKETSKFIELSQAIISKHSEFLSKLETAVRAVRPFSAPAAPAAPTAPPAPPAHVAPPNNVMPPPTVSEVHVADIAEQIGNAVEKQMGSGISAHVQAPAPMPAHPVQPLPLANGDAEQTKQFKINGEADSLSPRPKFDFEDLKFGANFDRK